MLATRLTLAVLLLGASTTLALAQVSGPHPDEEIIDFGYAAWYGTGFYTVADRTVAVIRVPFSWSIREPEPQTDQWGWRWVLPATLGFYQFDFDLENIENVQTASFIPGVEFKFPLFQIWELQPFAQAGIGHDFSNSEAAYVYGTGVKSFVDLRSAGFNYRIANRLLFAGQTAQDTGARTGFASFEAGVDVSVPGSFTMFKREINTNLFVLISWFGNRAEFLAPRDEEKVSRINEFGFSLGAGKEFRLWNFEIPRLGMSYLFGDNDFRGIRFNMGFPF